MSIFVNREIVKRSRALQRSAFNICLVTILVAGGVNCAFAQQGHNYSQNVVDALGKAQVAADSGRLDEAKNLYAKIIKIDSQCPEAYVGLGHVYLLMGKYAEAEPPYEAALKMRPSDANIYNGIGNAAYRQGHYAQAIENFEQALKYATDDTYKIHANLANALTDSHHVDEAIKHFAKAIELKPDYAPAYNGLATMYYNNKRYEEAVQNARKAISLKPEYAMGYYNLGISLIQLNRISEARTALKESLKYERNQSYIDDTRRILAKIDGADSQPAPTIAENSVVPQEIERLLKSGQWNSAERGIQTEIHAGGEKSAILWNNLGYAQMHQGGKYKQAKASFEKALALSNQRNATAHYNLGMLLRLMNDNKGAEAAFRRSIDDAKQTRTPCALAQNALGIVLKRKNDFSGAEAAYRKALMDSDGDLPVIHYNRAIVLERLDNSREAVREYKAYLTRAPNGKNAKQAQLRLKMLGIEAG